MPDIELKLGNQIGSGMFGEVFEGEDPVHGQVAVKIFRRDHPLPEADEQWRKRKEALLKEGQRLSHADHVNVVRSINRRVLAGRASGAGAMTVMIEMPPMICSLAVASRCEAAKNGHIQWETANSRTDLICERPGRGGECWIPVRLPQPASPSPTRHL